MPFVEMPSNLARCGAALALMVTVSASAAPLLRCELNQGGETRLIEAAAVSDPYAVKAVDLNRRFRFKAVVVGSEARIDYVKLYAYYLSRGQAVLLHELKYLPPFPVSAAGPAGLTGWHYLYSPVLGRELLYGCTLAEAAR